MWLKKLVTLRQQGSKEEMKRRTRAPISLWGCVSSDILFFRLSPPLNGSTTSQQCPRLGIQTFNMWGFGVHARLKLWFSPSLHSVLVRVHNFLGISSHTMCFTKSWAAGMQQSNDTWDWSPLVHIPTPPCPVNACWKIQCISVCVNNFCKLYNLTEVILLSFICMWILRSYDVF